MIVLEYVMRNWYKIDHKIEISEPMFEIFTVLESGGQDRSKEPHIAFYRYYFGTGPVPDRNHWNVPVT